MYGNEFAELIRTIRREWDLAEEAVKQAEEIGDQVVIPAIF